MSSLGINLAAARTISNSPIGFRWLLKATGEKVLQAAYQWTQGSWGGIEWREIDTVFETEIGRSL